MGETLDWINSCIEEGMCDENGEIFSGDPEDIPIFECIVLDCNFGTDDEVEMNTHLKMHFEQDRQRDKERCKNKRRNMQQRQGSGFMRAQDAIKEWDKKGIPANKRFLFGVILAVRKNTQRDASAPFLIDFDTDVLPGASTLRANEKICKKIAALAKTDDERQWVGLGIVLATMEYKDFNPGFVVAKVSDQKTVAKNRKSKPKYFYPGVQTGDEAPEPSFDGLENMECPF